MFGGWLLGCDEESRQICMEAELLDLFAFVVQRQYAEIYFFWAFNYYVKLIQDVWSNPNTDFSSWHVTLLKVLYKGKGPKTKIIIVESP